jgi:serine/threonine-protein kinase
MMSDDPAAPLVQSAIGDRFRLEPVPPDFPTGQPPWRLFPATEVSTGRKVLVKAIPLEGGPPEIGLRFEREVGSVESAPSWLGQPHLPNPRLLPVLSRSGRDNIIYYVTPWLSEGSLRARLQRQPTMPVADALAIVDDTAAAVGFLHERGFVHGRLKPENVLFEGGRAVLADGFARVVGLVVVLRPRLEMDYDSPEFLRGEYVGSARSDVYSLAVIAFEMLAGRRPFLGTAVEAVYKKLTGTAPPITSLRPEISPALSDVLQKALSPNPADRFADANELRRELNAAAP